VRVVTFQEVSGRGERLVTQTHTVQDTADPLLGIEVAVDDEDGLDIAHRRLSGRVMERCMRKKNQMREVNREMAIW
jgi:hypothetical protein